MLNTIYTRVTRQMFGKCLFARGMMCLWFFLVTEGQLYCKTRGPAGKAERNPSCVCACCLKRSLDWYVKYMELAAQAAALRIVLVGICSYGSWPQALALSCRRLFTAPGGRLCSGLGFKDRLLASAICASLWHFGLRQCLLRGFLGLRSLGY